MVKVFVGNLAFKTTEAELAKEFAAAGKVVSANIITRGPRSLGYGFVEFENLDDANKAVTILNKKEIDGRQVNVEVAKPRPEGEEAAEADQGSQQTRGGNRRRGGFRGRRGGARGGRGGRVEGSSQGQQSEEVEDTARPRGGFRPRRARGGRGAARGGRGGARGGAKDQPDTRVPSKTTLFVANLPFALDNDSFAKIFNDDSLKFKTAHVVTKRNGRSKGFGFAEFDTEEDQKKALTALNGKKIQERELSVKIALIDDAAKPVAAEEQQQK
jgi:RNA recognition motif-containing protein